MKRARLRTVFGGRRAFAGQVAGNDVTLLHDGESTLPAMLDAIEHARFEILLEMYWFGSDETGWRFARALGRKAQEGVAVCVLYDAIGSWDSSEAVFDFLRSAGCRVHEFHPIAPWRQRFNVGVVNDRDHRKILAVDGRIGFTGGTNLGDPWAPIDEGGSGYRDDMIRIVGPAARQMRDIFLHTWAALDEPPPPVRAAELPAGEEVEDGAKVRVLANRYRGERRSIRREYLQRIDQAERYVFITNSYFVPDAVVRRTLAAAARRGVDVRVLLPGESDVPAVQYAARSLYGWLIRHGIRPYEWQRTILHAKSAVIDDRWCTVGSYNLDWRSWRFNLEVTAVVEDEGVASAMKKRFEGDLTQSALIDSRQWRYRSLSDRVLERFFFTFRKLL